MNDFEDGILLLIIAIALLLFWGEPDLYDGIMYNLMGDCTAVQVDQDHAG